MVRTVNLVMAVPAVFSNHALVKSIGWNIVTAIRRGRMKRCRVTLLAQPGCAGHQQVRIVGSMRCMAIGAVFTHRLVFPQERSTFFGMAVIAGFVNRAALQLAGSATAVRVMTIRASQQAGVRSSAGCCLYRVMRLS